MIKVVYKRKTKSSGVKFIWIKTWLKTIKILSDSGSGTQVTAMAAVILFRDQSVMIRSMSHRICLAHSLPYAVFGKARDVIGLSQRLTCGHA